MTLKDTIRPRLPAWADAIWQHWDQHGAFPRLLRPKTFCDKVLHRILFERDRRLTETTDKLRARAYVEKRLGADILPKLLHVTDDPATIPFDDLPPQFIVKPTHGSGWFEVVRDKTLLDHATLIATCRAWLAQSFYARHREWAYKNVVPRILVQELIDDGSGPAPLDYRVYTFGGKAMFIIVDKMENGIVCSRFFDLDWRRLDISNGLPEFSGEVPRPTHLDEMIRAAEILAEDTSFVRVDFFDTAAQLYFVEMTWTPNAGFKRFHPPVYERHFGDLWAKPGRSVPKSLHPIS